MQSTSETALLQDGTHVFPVLRIRRYAGSEIEGATGEIRWSADQGITVRFEFSPTAPAINRLLASRQSIAPVGMTSNLTSQPDWTCALADGTEVQLFGSDLEEDVNVALSIRGDDGSRVAHGRAVYATMTIPKDSELAFWHDTISADRVFILGFDVSKWPVEEKVTFARGAGISQRCRGSMPLGAQPQFCVYSAFRDVQLDDAIWLTCLSTEGHDAAFHSPVWDLPRSFLSFLAGRRVTMCWRDSYLDEARLFRVYYGLHRRRNPGMDHEQPVPLARTVEALRHSSAVVAQLPSLFDRFEKIQTWYSVDWIMTPLWYAFQGYLDDILALACLSLERLVGAHNEARRQRNSESLKGPLLSHNQLTALKDALKPVLRSVGSVENIPETIIEILERKIDGLAQAPNTYAHERVFTDLGIDLNAAEKDVLNNRNRCLHGRRTLANTSDSSAVDLELQRFDALRTMINRAILSLLGYSGPYVDYAERPPKGNFPIKTMIPVNCDIRDGIEESP
jgi:hypothetical protein